MSLLPALLLVAGAANGCDSAVAPLPPARVWIQAPASVDTAGLGLAFSRRLGLADGDSLLVTLDPAAPVALQQLSGTLYKQSVTLRLGRLGDAPVLTLQKTALADSPAAGLRKALDAVKPDSEELDSLIRALRPANR